MKQNLQMERALEKMSADFKVVAEQVKKEEVGVLDQQATSALKSKYRDVDCPNDRLTSMGFDCENEKSLPHRTILIKNLMSSMHFPLNNN